MWIRTQDRQNTIPFYENSIFNIELQPTDETAVKLDGIIIGYYETGDRANCVIDEFLRLYNNGNLTSPYLSPVYEMPKE